MYLLRLLLVHVLARKVIARSLKAQTLAVCTISAAKILCILFKHTCQDSMKATLILNCSKNCSEKWSVKMCFVISYKWFRNFHSSGLHLGSKISGWYFHFRVGRRKTKRFFFHHMENYFFMLHPLPSWRELCGMLLYQLITMQTDG